MREKITLEEAQYLLHNEIKQIQYTEMLPLDQALGRVLVRDASAIYDQPPFARSPLDGYAVKGTETLSATSDAPVRLHVVGKIYAGEVFDGVVGAGQAVRIMTGAPIPEGADTVIRQEDTDYGKAAVVIYRGSKPFQNYCPAGEDYKAGQVLLNAGTLLGAGELAILSSMGMGMVEVFRQPQVAVFSTGDELIAPGNDLIAGKIYDSNRIYVSMRLKELGIPVVKSLHLKDDGETVAAQIRESSATCDLIITTGGVSVGEKDIMHEVCELLDARPVFWRVRLKPGSPTLAFVYEGTLVVCLSGNPYGAIVNTDLLLRDLLSDMTGNPRIALHPMKVKLADAFQKPSGMRRFLRGYYDGNQVILGGRNQLNGAIASMAGCNCFVEIPPDRNGAEEGAMVTIYPL